MKRAYQLTVMACGLLAMLAMPALAINGGMSKADIPFAFAAAGKSFNPGTYVVQRNTLNGVITLSDLSGKSVMMMGHPTSSAKPSEKGRLVFDRTSKGYALSEVWSAGASHGNRVKKTSGEPVLVALY
jgi:hypothetical protein